MQKDSNLTSDERVRQILSEAGRYPYEKRIPWLHDLESLSRPTVLAHENRVGSISAAICRRIGMKSARVDEISDASRWHDIGKLAIDDAILYKPGRLDPREMAEMRKHANYSHRLLKSAGASEVVLNVARYHHERYDGRGYFGLKGEEIPFEARIVSIADIFDALVSQRSYKAAFRDADALMMMCADLPSPAFGRRAFDPILLRTFVSMKLAGTGLDAEPYEREHLEEFASSNPMSDFLPGELPEGLILKQDGHRLSYGEDNAGNRRLLSVTDLTGEKIFDRGIDPDMEQEPVRMLSL